MDRRRMMPFYPTIPVVFSIIPSSLINAVSELMDQKILPLSTPAQRGPKPITNVSQGYTIYIFSQLSSKVIHSGILKLLAVTGVLIQYEFH